MKYEMVRFGDYFELRKGFSYSGQNLADESDVGFVTLNSFVPGGGYKAKSEKPLVGDIPEKFFLHDGDVCLAMTEQDKGLLASGLVVDYESNDYSSLVYSHHVAKLFPIQSGLDATFVYNVLRIPAFRVRAAYGDAGSTVQDLPYQAMYEQEIPCPPLEVQRAISELIFSIDRKIRVNQQIASTLEQIAQTIFKSWFVDFDPVHAKARGEQPVGMDAETAALFPDLFEDSELGLIPTGWRPDALSSNFSLISGGTPKTSIPEYWNGDIPWYSVVDAPDSAPYFIATSKHITELGISKSAVNRIDIDTTIISARGTVGKVAMAGVPCTFNQSCYGIKGHSTDYYTYLLVLNSVKKLQAMTHGGTFDTITRATFDGIKVATVPSEVQTMFEETVKPFFVEMRLAVSQNQTLMRLRDSLLPRLISGELEIPAELLEI